MHIFLPVVRSFNFR